ncbi:MAG: adenylyl-sulfate reductase subunit beta [Thermoplasma acidophilum]|nr:adenylyl-sulfate reductase subunit beta [Thermoplasma acidophilum]
MPTFVYTSRCVGCGDCVDICPNDLMHFNPKNRKPYNIEPEGCWECLNCVKVCNRSAIEVRGYADFVPMGATIDVLRDEKRNMVFWRIKYRNGKVKEFSFPIRTKPWGSIKRPGMADPNKLRSELLSDEPEIIGVRDLKIPSITKEVTK